MRPLLQTLVFIFLYSASLALDTERCGKPLGMKSNEIPDHAVTASSHFDDAVNAFNGRAHVERGGGAWCPQTMVHDTETEFLEIDLKDLHTLTKVEVQGRFGNGHGKEFAEKFKVRYWRPGLSHWVTYRNGKGEEIFEGNSNTYLAKGTQLSPPVRVTKVRFVPFSDHPRTVCMRVEIYGCPYQDGLVSYSMIDGDSRDGGSGLRDSTYDGSRDQEWLTGGLGQLTDGETGHTNFLVDAIAQGRGYEWVGWNNASRGDSNPVEITFEFDVVRNFSSLQIYSNNFFTRDTMVFSRARISFSVEGEFFTASTPVVFDSEPDRIFESARNVFLDLRGSRGRFVKLQLFFALPWIMISEVQFDSIPCKCNATDDDPSVLDALNRDVDGESNSDLTTTSSTSSSGLVLGCLVTLGVVFGVVVVAVGFYYYRNRRFETKSKTPTLTTNGSDSRKVSMKMRDFHINMNLSSGSNGYTRAKGKLYGHVHMEEEVAAMYQEPYKGPIHNPGYYTLNRTASPSETPLKRPLADADDSVDYAVPDVNMTPPPPFSEVYTPPPPVPLSRPPHSLPGRLVREAPPPPVPSIPPPPEQQYFTAPHLCQPSNIQGAIGTVSYAVVDASHIQQEAPLSEIPRHRVQFVEVLGEGLFGTVQLCEVSDFVQTGGTPSSVSVSKRLAAAKVLSLGANEVAKEKLRAEAHVLSHLDDPNIVQILGVMTRHEPMALISEYLENGDLYQFLRRHVSEGTMLTNGRGSPSPILSYGALIYISSQIAAGMKYLEDMKVVHRDLAARNCLVGRKLSVKISDLAMSQPLYSEDYYRMDNHAVLPIRWMAWEAILQGRFTSKSDVWSFGVTLWEILMMGRRRPYDELSDEGVLENVSHCYHDDGSGMILPPQPTLCPREMYDIITACWRPVERQRPPFWEIHLFLQRKNLGYSYDYEE